MHKWKNIPLTSRSFHLRHHQSWVRRRVQVWVRRPDHPVQHTPKTRNRKMNRMKRPIYSMKSLPNVSTSYHSSYCWSIFLLESHGYCFWFMWKKFHFGSVTSRIFFAKTIVSPETQRLVAALFVPSREAIIAFRIVVHSPSANIQMGKGKAVPAAMHLHHHHRCIQRDIQFHIFHSVGIKYMMSYDLVNCSSSVFLIATHLGPRPNKRNPLHHDRGRRRHLLSKNQNADT